MIQLSRVALAGDNLARVPRHVEERPAEQISHMVVVSTVGVGTLAALLVWEIEHTRSVPLTLLIVAMTVTVCGGVLWRTRRTLDRLAHQFDDLVRTADEQFRRAEAANRLKDEFLDTVSHELRTPLNAVLGWARLLDSGKLSPEQTARAVQAIERAGWAQARIIEDLLDVSQILGGRTHLALRPTSMKDLIADVVQSLEAGADAKSVRVDIAVDPQLPPYDLDPDRVRQMLWHLLSNAIKFTPPDGRVEIGAAQQGRQLEFWVSDSGIGFDPEVAAHLFERFRQGDGSSTRPYGGLGLGLGMVRHLAELHGGAVSARSAGPGRGARFGVTLPARGSMSPRECDQAREPPPTLRGVTVLVVDDDNGALDMIRTTLERFGARVMTAASANEAMECLERRHADVLLSDLRMPNGHGLELIRRVRASRGRAWRIPAAAVTALVRVEDRRRALDAGYQIHVAKPVDPLELASTVAWLSHQRPAEDGPMAPVAH